MKITKHVGVDMRAAMRSVREQLGPDAVIMSTRRTAGGVEITAAIDFDVEAAEAIATQAAVEAETAATPGYAPRAAAEDDSAEIAFSEVFARAASASKAAPAPVAAAAAPNTLEADVGSELKTMRRILETQLAQLAWNDLSRRSPIQTELLRELTEVGLAHDFAAQVISQLPPRSDLTQARRLAIATLSQHLLVTGDRWLDQGGRVALVGPTGVGKTTSLAKLAVRWALRHGARDLALVSADSIRFGAHDQIRSIGQLIGAPVFAVEQLSQVPDLLSRLGAYRFILIDTPGSSQRDAQLAGRLAELGAAGAQLEAALVLSANTQAGAIEESVARFANANPASCLLTKVDEAASLGGVLSVLTRAKLPISYVCEGQRVPEDLRPARALELVSSAVQLAHTNGAAADEDLLRRRFGEVAHAIA
jgi:flagellar biosynthesis protein FlhF